MTLTEALAWADKNAQPEAVERLRSRSVAKTLADEVRRLQAKITWLEDQNEALKDSFAIEGAKCDRLREALEAFELLWAGADRSEWDGKAIQHFDELKD